MVPLVAAIAVLQTAVKLSPIFSDGVVLQRDMDDRIFGAAPAGTFVQVQIGNQRAGASTDASGRWQVTLKPLPAGGPYTMSVSSGNLKIQVQDVLVGEVWIASGQSNMEFPESQADDYQQAQSEGNRNVRMFIVNKTTAENPVQTVSGSWDDSTSVRVGRFSAVALAYARELNRKLNVPVGIIDAAWGGTPAEAWTSKEALERDPNLKPLVDAYQDDLAHYTERKAAYTSAMTQWLDSKMGGQNLGFENGWAMFQLQDSDWKVTSAASMVDNIEGREVLGSFWYRQSVQIPDDWYGKPLRLELGEIDDYDDTYFNGVRVGHTDRKMPDAASAPRAYSVAPGLVRKGLNTIAVRVFNAEGPGGMRGPADDMKLGLLDGSASVPLSGDWKFKIEQEIDPNAARPHLPAGPHNPNSPSELFNGMISPLLQYTIRGAIWYQGEANVGRADQYASLFPDMIGDWRQRWGEPQFPFYYVQLANFHPRLDHPADSDWAALREAQTKALSIPNTGMAVIIDIGDADDIHAKNKREVGRRLSLWALSQTYHLPMNYGSPIFRSMAVAGDRVRVLFGNGSLTTTDGQPPRGFAIAGSDRHFYWATATIDGSSVILSSPQVPQPVAVRYGWADNPDVNLINHAELPACPFRTDTWDKTLP